MHKSKLHIVPAGDGEWLTTPVFGSHASSVHALPSLVGIGVPDWQTPAPSQVSPPLHRSASLQAVPAATGVWTTPPSGEHESAVQGLPSSMATGVPPPHAPVEQLSATVHALPSSHEAPSAFGGFEQMPVAGAHVPASWHWSSAVHATGLPPAQLPALHVSVCVQASPSSQLAPFALGGFEQVPVLGLHVPATWHWSVAVQTIGFDPAHAPD